MAAVLTVIGWLALLGFAGLTVLLLHQLFSEGRSHGALSATAALIAACGAICAAGLLGVVPGLAAIIFGVVFAVAAAVLSWDLLRRSKGPHRALRLLSALQLLTRHVVKEAFTSGRKAAGKRHRPPDELAPRRNPKPAEAPPPQGRPPVRAIPDSRPAPRPRRAPALAATPLPRAVAQGRVSQAWAQVISGIRDFEPESDTEFLAHWNGQAAGLVGVADAMLDQTETLGDDGIGLATIIIDAVHDGGDVVSDGASALASICEALHRAYEGSRGDAAAGHDLPKDGRWVTGEDAG